MKVEDLMQTDVVTLRVTDTVEVADDLMHLGLIRHLPVVDVDHQLVGLIAQADLLKASASSVSPSIPAIEKERLKTVAVRDVMVTNLTTITAEAEIAEAVDLMTTSKL